MAILIRRPWDAWQRILKVLNTQARAPVAVAACADPGGNRCSKRWAEHGEALLRRRKPWYYEREPRPDIAVIGARLSELMGR